MEDKLTFILFLLVLIGVFYYIKNSRFCDPKKDVPSKPRFILTLQAIITGSLEPIVTKGNTMSLVMRNDQEVQFQPILEDAHGNVVTTLDIPPMWSVSDETLGTITAQEDGFGATFTPSGKTGTVQVNVLIDALPGEGEELLVGTADIQILAGKVAVIRLEGVLRDKALAQPAEPETPANPEPETPVDPEPEVPVQDPVQEPGNGDAQDPQTPVQDPQ